MVRTKRKILRRGACRHIPAMVLAVLGIAAVMSAVHEPITLTYNPGSTVKVEQVIGDCDLQPQAQQIVKGRTVTCSRLPARLSPDTTLLAPAREGLLKPAAG